MLYIYIASQHLQSKFDCLNAYNLHFRYIKLILNILNEANHKFTIIKTIIYIYILSESFVIASTLYLFDKKN